MNRIVNVPCRYIRSLARQALQGAWGEAVLLCLICFALLQIPAEIINNLPLNTFTAMLGYIVTFVTFAINGPLTLSMGHYFLKVFRGEDHSIDDIRYGFTNLTRAMLLFIRIYFFTWLWSLLFIIPGIMASLRYSQSYLILSDDPTKTPKQCMDESIFMMRGNLLKYFSLMLSYIGWMLIPAIPYFIWIFTNQAYLMEQINTILSATTPEQMMGVAINVPSWVIIAGGILSCPVTAYYTTAGVCFYDILFGNLVFERAPEEPEAAEPETAEAPQDQIADEKSFFKDDDENK